MNLDSLTSNETQNDLGEMTGKSQDSAHWSVADIESLLNAPFNDLIYRAQSVHRQYHDANGVQLSTLISVKTGGCPEDCGYCPQAARYHTGVENQDLLSLDEVVSAASAAKAKGASRFCMGLPGAARNSAISRK
jgi:biotin synthase